MPEELPEAYRSCCLKIGSYMVIRNVLEEYHLPQLLYKRLGSNCGLFLDLVSYLIVDENDVRSTAAEISGLLTADQSLLCSSKAEEDENGQDESISFFNSFLYS